MLRSNQQSAESARLIDQARGMPLDYLWIAGLLALIWLFISVTPLPPNDLWWHMAAGREMVARGGIIDVNLWAYTLPADAPYVYQSWLSELLMYGLWRLGDVPLLSLARTLAITFSYGLIAWHAWRGVRNGKIVALALFLAVLVGWNNWTLRPQTLALLPGAIFAVALGEYLAGRASARWLAALPVMMLLWVNIHGSFAIGLALLGLAWLGAALSLGGAGDDRRLAWGRMRALTLAGGATLLATLANPLGTGIFGYVRGMMSNAPLQRWFVEWQPPRNQFGLASTGFWFFVMLLLLAALMARAPRRPSAVSLLWYCGLAWLAIGGVRYAMWFALLLAPLLAEQIAAFRPPRAPVLAGRAFVAVFALLLGGLMIATLPWFTPSRYLGPGAERLFATAGPYRMLLSGKTPIPATDWLERNPIEGRFWTDMSYSSYTIWRLPEKQVFADLRVELFPEAIWLDYFAISKGDQASLELLDRWQISHLLLDRDWQKSLHALLTRTPGWCEVYSDSTSAVVARC